MSHVLNRGVRGMNLNLAEIKEINSKYNYFDMFYMNGEDNNTD